MYVWYYFLSLLSFSNPSRHLFLLFLFSEGWFRVNFDSKITPPSCFFLYPNWISDFTYCLFFRLFLWFRRLWTTLFVLISRLCAMCFDFPVLVRCLFDSGWKISFEQVQINDNDFDVVNVADPKTWVIQRHEYSHISHICRHIYFVVLCY